MPQGHAGAVTDDFNSFPTLFRLKQHRRDQRRPVYVCSNNACSVWHRSVWSALDCAHPSETMTMVWRISVYRGSPVAVASTCRRDATALGGWRKVDGDPGPGGQGQRS